MKFKTEYNKFLALRRSKTRKQQKNSAWLKWNVRSCLFLRICSSVFGLVRAVGILGVAMPGSEGRAVGVYTTSVYVIAALL